MTTEINVEWVVQSNGLAASVDALKSIVAGVSAYFTLPARAIPSPIPVLTGDWNAFQAATYGPPGAVTVASGDFSYGSNAQSKSALSALRWRPGDVLTLSGGAAKVPVVGVRWQMFKIWVHGLQAAGATFSTDAPGDATAAAQQAATFALADLSFAAFRDIHGHDIEGPGWKIENAAIGEFGYGAVLTGQIGPIPVPVLGDIFPVISPNLATGNVVGGNASTGYSTPGDPVEAG